MISGQRLKRMIVKEVRQFTRDRVMPRMAIMIPLVQTFVLSFAANTDVVHVPMVVCDQDHSQTSRDLIDKLAGLPQFELKGYELSEAGIERHLQNATAEVGIRIPPGFARDITAGKATVQILVDGADSLTAATAAAYITAAAARYDVKAKTTNVQRFGLRGNLPTVTADTRVFYNPDLRSMWFFSPGVMAVLLFVLMQNLSALSIAKERELGTFEQMVMTPIRPTELLLGKLIPYAVVGILDTILVGCLIVFVLHVPFRGSLVALSVATLIFLVATLGLGLLVSAAAANQQQAQLLNFFLAFPSILLSGFIFPQSNLPHVLWWVSRFIPMTYYLEVIRGVFLKGSGMGVLLVPQIVPMAALATVFFVAGVRRFRKRLD